jgi:hypothetical protein
MRAGGAIDDHQNWLLARGTGNWSLGSTRHAAMRRTASRWISAGNAMGDLIVI